MGGFPDYTSYDGLGLAELVRRGEVKPIELVEACIGRIERFNRSLNAVIDKLYDRAQAQAREPLPEGPFRGVPFLLKDLHAMLKGVPTRYGSQLYGEWTPDRDSELVRRYRKAGVVFVGKTNTPEFGMTPTTEPERFGPTRNPWDTTRTPGGSSGGSAAAVATRMVPIAHGGDGGGSIRIPASCCGLVGLKPSRGRTPCGPFDSELWHGWVVEHVLTRSVRDCAAMLDATAGAMLGDTNWVTPPERPFRDEVTAPTGRLRIAFTSEPFLPADVHPDCRAAVEDVAKLLEDLGHEVVEARPELDGAAFARAFMVQVSTHVHQDIETAAERVGCKPRRKDVEGKVWLAYRMAEAYTASDYLAALEHLQGVMRDMLRFSEGYDVLLTPTLASPPPPLGFLKPTGMQAFAESLARTLPITRLIKGSKAADDAAAAAYAFIPWTPVFNVSGQPSMSLPLHWNVDGLPIGVMFTGRYGDEATLFRLAGQLEQARPWADRVPPGCE